MGCSRSKTEFPCVPNLLGATICWLTTSPLVLPSLSRASNAILSSTRPREGPQSTQLRRSRQVSRTAGVGQTLPSDAPSANDRSRTVSGSSSLRSRASAQRRKRNLCATALFSRSTPKAAPPHAAYRFLYGGPTDYLTGEPCCRKRLKTRHGERKRGNVDQRRLPTKPRHTGRKESWRLTGASWEPRSATAIALTAVPANSTPCRRTGIVAAYLALTSRKGIS